VQWVAPETLRLARVLRCQPLASENVLLLRYHFEVRGVYATPDPTQVVQLLLVRHRAGQYLVSQPIGQVRPESMLEPGIPVDGYLSRPQPAPGSLVNDSLGPEADG
jgi:hypothetical protein